jgi:hypothetical protein
VKRASSILFLTLLLSNGMGFYFFYGLHLYNIKTQMKESLKSIPEDQLEILELSELQYEESIVEDGEIKVKGRMYDVARISRMNGMVKIYCLHDEKEDNLIALLDELVAKPIKNQNSIPSEIFEFLSLVFIDTSASPDFSVDESASEKNNSYHFTSKTILLELTTPPPRLALHPLAA